MKKLVKITGIAVALVAVIVFIGAATVSAQGPNNPDDSPTPGVNQAQRQGGGGMGYMAVTEADMHAAIAEALKMSPEDFEQALAEGKTPAQLAIELGIDLADIQAAMDAVHGEALQQAVGNGLITQEQADWMLSHRGGQNGQGNGMGRSNAGAGGVGGGMGRGPGGGAGFGGECPYQTP